MNDLFVVTIKGGGISFGNPANKTRFNSFLARHEGKKAEIRLIKVVRTDRQNRFYRAYLQMISDWNGDDTNALHLDFKTRLLPPKRLYANGKWFDTIASTTDLSKVEFGEYLDRICAETGVPLPNPEDLEGYIPH